MLLDWRTLGFSPEEFELLEGAPILVRCGRSSFYTTVLPSDRSFNVFIAINGEALHSKSKIYIGRALARKGGGDLDEYQLWASAFEEQADTVA